MAESAASQSRKKSEEVARRNKANQELETVQLLIRKAEQIVNFKKEISEMALNFVGVCKSAIKQAESNGEFVAEVHAYEAERLFRNPSYWHAKYPFLDLKTQDVGFESFFEEIKLILARDEYRVEIVPRTTNYHYDGMPCHETVKYIIIKW